MVFGVDMKPKMVIGIDIFTDESTCYEHYVQHQKATRQFLNYSVSLELTMFSMEIIYHDHVPLDKIKVQR
jgi:hypothetical protein